MAEKSAISYLTILVHESNRNHETHLKPIMQNALMDKKNNLKIRALVRSELGRLESQFCLNARTSLVNEFDQKDTHSKNPFDAAFFLLRFMPQTEQSHLIYISDGSLAFQIKPDVSLVSSMLAEIAQEVTNAIAFLPTKSESIRFSNNHACDQSFFMKMLNFRCFYLYTTEINMQTISFVFDKAETETTRIETQILDVTEDTMDWLSETISNRLFVNKAYQAIRISEYQVNANLDDLLICRRKEGFRAIQSKEYEKLDAHTGKIFQKIAIRLVRYWCDGLIIEYRLRTFLYETRPIRIEITGWLLPDLLNNRGHGLHSEARIQMENAQLFIQQIMDRDEFSKSFHFIRQQAEIASLILDKIPESKYLLSWSNVEGFDQDFLSFWNYFFVHQNDNACNTIEGTVDYVFSAKIDNSSVDFDAASLISKALESWCTFHNASIFVKLFRIEEKVSYLAVEPEEYLPSKRIVSFVYGGFLITISDIKREFEQINEILEQLRATEFVSISFSPAPIADLLLPLYPDLFSAELLRRSSVYECMPVNDQCWVLFYSENNLIDTAIEYLTWTRRKMGFTVVEADCTNNLFHKSQILNETELSSHFFNVVSKDTRNFSIRSTTIHNPNSNENGKQTCQFLNDLQKLDLRGLRRLYSWYSLTASSPLNEHQPRMLLWQPQQPSMFDLSCVCIGAEYRSILMSLSFCDNFTDRRSDNRLSSYFQGDSSLSANLSLLLNGNSNTMPTVNDVLFGLWNGNSFYDLNPRLKRLIIFQYFFEAKIVNFFDKEVDLTGATLEFGSLLKSVAEVNCNSPISSTLVQDIQYCRCFVKYHLDCKKMIIVFFPSPTKWYADNFQLKDDANQFPRNKLIFVFENDTESYDSESGKLLLEENVSLPSSVIFQSNPSKCFIDTKKALDIFYELSCLQVGYFMLLNGENEKIDLTKAPEVGYREKSFDIDLTGFLNILSALDNDKHKDQIIIDFDETLRNFLRPVVSSTNLFYGIQQQELEDILQKKLTTAASPIFCHLECVIRMLDIDAAPSEPSSSNIVIPIKTIPVSYVFEYANKQTDFTPPFFGAGVSPLLTDSKYSVNLRFRVTYLPTGDEEVSISESTSNLQSISMNIQFMLTLLPQIEIKMKSWMLECLAYTNNLTAPSMNLVETLLLELKPALAYVPIVRIPLQLLRPNTTFEIFQRQLLKGTKEFSTAQVGEFYILKKRKDGFAPGWLFMKITSTSILLYMFSKSLTEIIANDIIQEVKMFINAISHLSHQYVLLQDLNQNHSASKLLIPPDNDDDSSDTDDEERVAQFEVGKFACSIVNTKTFNLHNRIKIAQAINFLASNVLHSLSINNRRNLFVYARDGNVHYIRLSELISTPDNEADFPNSVTSGESITELEQNFVTTETSTSSGFPVRQSSSVKLYLEVFGIESLSQEVYLDFTSMIESRLLTLTVNFFGSLLSRNPNIKYTQEDLDLLIRSEKPLDIKFSLPVLRKVFETVDFRTQLRQALLNNGAVNFTAADSKIIEYMLKNGMSVTEKDSIFIFNTVTERELSNHGLAVITVMYDKIDIPDDSVSLPCAELLEKLLNPSNSADDVISVVIFGWVHGNVDIEVLKEKIANSISHAYVNGSLDLLYKQQFDITTLETVSAHTFDLLRKSAKLNHPLVLRLSEQGPYPLWAWKKYTERFTEIIIMLKIANNVSVFLNDKILPKESIAEKEILYDPRSSRNELLIVSSWSMSAENNFFTYDKEKKWSVCLSICEKEIELTSHGLPKSAETALVREVQKLNTRIRSRAISFYHISLIKLGLGHLTEHFVPHGDCTFSLNQIIASPLPVSEPTDEKKFSELPRPEKPTPAKSSSRFLNDLRMLPDAFEQRYLPELVTITKEHDPVQPHSHQALLLMDKAQKFKESKQFERETWERWSLVTDSSSTESQTGFTATEMKRFLRNARILHWVRTPILFSSVKDNLFLPTNASSFICSYANTFSMIEEEDEKEDISADEKEQLNWFKQLIRAFMDDYISYLVFLGMTVVLRADGRKVKTGTSTLPPEFVPKFRVSGDLTVDSSLAYLQKTFLGGVLIAEVQLQGLFACVNLYTMKNYFKLSPKANRLTFTEECGRFKNITHVNSFVYDFHIRQMQNLLMDPKYLKQSQLDLLETITSFLRYNTTPANYARNRISPGTFTLPNDMTTSDFFKYVARNPKNFDVQNLMHGSKFRACYIHSSSPLFTNSSSTDQTITPNSTYYSLVFYESDVPNKLNYVILSAHHHIRFPFIYRPNEPSTSISPLPNHPTDTGDLTDLTPLSDLHSIAILKLISLSTHATRLYNQDFLWRQLVSGSSGLHHAGLSLTEFTSLSSKYGQKKVSSFDPSVSSVFELDVKWEEVVEFMKGVFERTAREFVEERDGGDEDGREGKERVRYLVIFNPRHSDMMVQIRVSRPIHNTDSDLQHETETEESKSVVEMVAVNREVLAAKEAEEENNQDVLFKSRHVEMDFVSDVIRTICVYIWSTL